MNALSLAEWNAPSSSALSPSCAQTPTYDLNDATGNVLLADYAIAHTVFVEIPSGRS